MKSIKYWTLLAALGFGCIFYQQGIGVNYLLLSLLVQALLVLQDIRLLKEKQWWVGSVIAFSTAFSVVLIGSDLSIVAFCLSHFYLPAFAFRRTESVFVSFVFSLYSFISAIPMAVIKHGEKEAAPQVQGRATKGANLLAVLISTALTFAFFLLYRSASPLFKNFSQQLDFSWISIGWLFACCLGYIILKGLSTNERFEDLSIRDAKALLPLQKTEAAEEGDKSMYRTAGLLLFIILNLFQLLVNAMDVNNLYIAAALPEGITLSDFVHQAVFGIMATIVIALLCISYLFHSWFNFDSKGRMIVKVALLWLLQAQVMLLNTVVRNWWYIQSYQLTYLRVLVFVVLLVCSMAVYYSWQKLQHKQSNWYLFNALFKALVVVLFSCSLVDWDRIITAYNLKHCKHYENLDISYLVKLSNANNDQLLPLLSSNMVAAEHKHAIRQKFNSAHLKDRYQQWPSWNLRAKRNESLYYNLYK